MRTLNAREQRLLIATLLFLGTVFLYTSIIEPRVRRGIVLERQLAEAKQELDAYDQLLRDRDKILKNTESIQKQIETGNDEETELTSLLKEVERLSRQSKIDSISLRPQRSREHSYYQLLGIQLTAEGGPEEVARFLHLMRESAQLLRVDTLTCNALKQPGRLRADFTIVKILNPGDA